MFVFHIREANAHGNVRRGLGFVPMRPCVKKEASVGNGDRSPGQAHAENAGLTLRGLRARQGSRADRYAAFTLQRGKMQAI